MFYCLSVNCSLSYIRVAVIFVYIWSFWWLNALPHDLFFLRDDNQDQHDEADDKTRSGLVEQSSKSTTQASNAPMFIMLEGLWLIISSTYLLFVSLFLWLSAVVSSFFYFQVLNSPKHYISLLLFSFVSLPDLISGSNCKCTITKMLFHRIGCGDAMVLLNRIICYHFYPFPSQIIDAEFSTPS